MAEPLKAIEAEAEADSVEDGLLYTLVTDRGSEKILVPPMKKWRSRARHAIISQGDDLLWAQLTLAPADLAKWMVLDPTGEESEEFFAAVMLGNGESLGKPGASRTSSRSTSRR